MQAIQLARIAVRVLALYFIFHGITALPELGLMWRDFDLDTYLSLWVAIFSLATLMPLLAGLLIWHQTPLFARWMVDRQTLNAQVLNISSRQILRIALMTVG